MWGVHPQGNGEVADPLVFTCHTVCLIFNLLHDGEEVHELLPLCMQKFPIFCRSVDQLQNKRPPGHNARSTGKEISGKVQNVMFNCWSSLLNLLSNKILKHWRFPRRLATNHSNLWKIYVVGHTKLGEHVLHPVHDGDELLHPVVAHRHDEAVVISLDQTVLVRAATMWLAPVPALANQ